jgi:hypothetical protein
MSNSLFDKARQRFLEGSINWNTDTIKAVLVDLAAWTPNLASNEYFADVSPSAYTGIAPVTLTGKSTAGGAAAAANVTFTSVSGASLEAIVLFKFVTNNADSPLIALIDTATGLPITPNGGDIIVTWDTGVNKIFRL